MTPIRLLAATILLVGTLAAGLLAARTSPGDDVAKRVWAVLDAVEKTHLAPPPRAEAIAAGVRGMLNEAGDTVPADLAERAAAVASEEQLRTLVHDVWPAEGGEKKLADDKLASALFAAALKSVPGEPEVRPVKSVKVMEQINNNRYVGIGIKVAVDQGEGRPRITPLRRGPAHVGGVKAGDVLLDIDGKDTRGVPLETIIDWARGAEGSTMTIVVKHSGENEPQTLKLTRGVVPFDSVFGYVRKGEDWDYRVDADAGIGYLCVKSINVSTLHELRQAERRLRADGVKALVLDLRFGGGGGSLRHAALVADGLLDAGLMWTVRGRGDATTEYRADRDCLFRGMPLAVLAYGSGDNALGAVLAALQDNRRATLIGSSAGGDGSVRQLVALPDGMGSVTVLSGRLERADKSRGWPVRPDHPVEMTQKQRQAVFAWMTAKEEPDSPAGAAGKPPEDPPLDRALELLRDELKAAPAAGGK
jgi:carboxyl-terminal processing protease